MSAAIAATRPASQKLPTPSGQLASTGALQVAPVLAFACAIRPLLLERRL